MFNRLKRTFWLRLFLSVILVVFIVNMVEAKRLIDLITSIRLPFLCLALALDIFERILMAYKWKVLLTTKKINLAFSQAVRLYFVSTFVGTFLPSSLGGDALRAFSLYKQGINSSEAISSIFVDRILSLLSSLIIAVVGVLFYSKLRHDGNVFQGIWVAVAGFGLFLFIAMNKRFMQFFIRQLGFFKLQRLQRKIEQVYSASIGYNAHKPALFYVLILSFLFQFVRVMVAFVGSQALNQNIDVTYFFIFVPIIILVAVLPIAVAGIGVREGAFVYFFSQVGMSASDAFTLSLLIYTVSMIATLPGGIIYVMKGLVLKETPTMGGGENQVILKSADKPTLLS